MSSVNYSLKHKGVRLLTSKEAWIKGKNGKSKLNPKYDFVGRIDTKLPNAIISTENRKPNFKGDFGDLNKTAKNQTVKHFFDEKGKRNRKTVAYYAIPKKK